MTLRDVTLLSTLLLATLASSGAPAAEPSWSRRPYRVQVRVAFADEPEFTAAMRATLLDRIRLMAVRRTGEMWQLQVAEEPRGLDVALPADGCDKLFLLTVARAGGAYQARGREWDAATQSWGEEAVRASGQRRELAQNLWGLLRELFQPVAAIEHRGGWFALRPLAGELRPPDPAWQPFADRPLWEPLASQRDRAERIPWTYLQLKPSATPPAGASAEAILFTGLRDPFPEAAPWQQAPAASLAIAVRRTPRPTLLHLMTRGGAEEALAGYDVEVTTPTEPAPKPPEATSAEPPAQPRRWISGRDGTLLLPFQPATPLVWLSIRREAQVLARVPFVPGARAEMTLALPDETVRRETERRLSLLQAALVDAVAERSVLLSQIRTALEDEDVARASALRAELAAVRSRTFFDAELTAIRVGGVRDAFATGDAETAAQITALCAAMTERLADSFDAVELKELDAELAAARGTSAVP